MVLARIINLFIKLFQLTLMTNLFTYGSLMFKEVIYELTKVKDYKSSNATLSGFKRNHVKGKVYPGVTPAIDSEVQGVVYFNVIE
jgi:gamma-glutamylcyclotransferase (GGCT)/AIG2-like uncharacterized protein YtfP